jgi:hypothetical protein
MGVRYFTQVFPHPQPPPQSQDGSVPRIMPLMIAAAQPTPRPAVIVPVRQFKAQAPHSMQRSLPMMVERGRGRFPPDGITCSIAKTLCGQTSMHFPQPLHFAVSSSRWMSEV